MSSLEGNSLDAADPLVLLLGRGGGDPVEGVVPLHHAPVRLRLAGLDHLVFVVRDEELKTVLKEEEEEERMFLRAESF